MVRTGGGMATKMGIGVGGAGVGGLSPGHYLSAHMPETEVQGNEA